MQELCHICNHGQAAVRVNGEAQCMRCLRGPMPQGAPTLWDGIPLTPEPRLLRRPPMPPRYANDYLLSDAVVSRTRLQLEADSKRRARDEEQARLRLERQAAADEDRERLRNLQARAQGRMATNYMRSMHAIVEALECEFGLAPGLLLQRTRTQAISRTRGLAMLLIHRETEASHARIARSFAMHHTSVMHQVARSTKQLQDEPGLAERLDRLMATVHNTLASTARTTRSGWFAQHGRQQDALRREMAETAQLVSNMPALMAAVEVRA